MHRPMTLRSLALAVPLALTLVLPAARADEEHFDIRAFTIDGNTLLPAELARSAVADFTGSARSYADVEGARDALERQYRKAGFGAVLVHVPEQELTEGLVRLQVIESRLATVRTIYAPPEGRNYFSEDNVRASLPLLRPGSVPNTPRIADNLQLSNENPAKKIDVVLKAGHKQGEIDADIAVQVSDPKKLFLTLDNSGNDATGNHRLGLGFQHANLFGRDHIATVNLTTSPEKPDLVAIYSVSYRVPLYALGDSIDFIMAKSDVNAGTTQTVAGALSFAGKGDVYGLRYNVLLPRRGEYAHRLVLALDYRTFDNTCSLAGFGAAGCGPSAADVTVRPLSVTYAGQWQRIRQAAEFAVTYAHNWAGAKNGNEDDFMLARPAANGIGGASANYALLRANGSYLASLGDDWQWRLAASVQYAFDPLIPAEQFGLSGASTVRGFSEREAATDSGMVANLEGYSPNLPTPFGAGANLRALAFVDAAQGRNRLLAGDAPRHLSLASAGVGLRFNLDKALQAKLDVASVIKGEQLQARGHWHGHFSLTYAF